MRRRDFLSFAGLAVAGFAADPTRALWSPLNLNILKAHYNPEAWWTPNPAFTEGGLLVPGGLDALEIPETVFSCALKVDTRLFNEKMDEAAAVMRRYIAQHMARAEERAFREGLLRGFDATA